MIEHRHCEGFGDIYVFNTDKFKAETISVYFLTPHEKENNVKKSLLLSLLKRGSKNYPSQKLLNKRLDELYATILIPKNKSLFPYHLLGFSADVIGNKYTDGEDYLSKALSLVSEIMLEPFLDAEGLFKSEYFESEKKNYKDIILSQINAPISYSALRCREEMLASLNESYKIAELCEEIDKVGRKELTEYYKSTVKNSALVVFYVGSKTTNEIEALVKNTFPKRNINELSLDVKGRALKNKAELSFVREERESSQSRLALGINTGINWFSDEVYTAMLCNEILGVSPISKLMINIREKMSLCYDCSSSFDMGRGVIFLSSGINSESFDLAKNAIFEQIEDLKKGKISKAELEAGKKSIKRAYASVFDSPNSIERVFLGRTVLRIDTDIEKIISTVEKLKVSDVASVAQRLSYDTLFFLDGKGEGDFSYEE